MSLHDELARIADAAPPMRVDTDPWVPARRSRRRRQAGAGAAVAAVIALTAGLGVWLPQTMDPPVAAGDGLAVPDHVEDVPHHLLDGGRGSERITTDSAVGPVAVAYVANAGANPDYEDEVVVLIGAEDGAYHLVDLPDRTGGIALSPDGTRLAYGGFRGLEVVDLETGAVRSVRSDVHTADLVSWSPDGQWLAFTSDQNRSERPVIGRVAPDELDATTVLLPSSRGGELGLTVSSTGRVTVVQEQQVVSWDGGDAATRAPYEREAGYPDSAAVSPDGSVVLVGDCCTRDAVLMDPDTAERSAVRLPAFASTTALGWLDDDTAVLQVMPQGGGGDGHLVLVGRDGGVREVGDVDDEAPDELSVAVDLMSADQPTVHRAAPDWPWSTATLWAARGGAALLVVLALLTFGLRRMGRRRPEDVSPVREGLLGFVLAGTLGPVWQAVTGFSGVFGEAIVGVWVASAAVALLASLLARFSRPLRPVAAGVSVGIVVLGAAELLLLLWFLAEMGS